MHCCPNAPVFLRFLVSEEVIFHILWFRASKTLENWQEIQPDESWPVVTWLVAYKTWRDTCSMKEITFPCVSKLSQSDGSTGVWCDWTWLTQMALVRNQPYVMLCTVMWCHSSCASCVYEKKTQRPPLFCAVFWAGPIDYIILLLHVGTCLQSCGLAIDIHITIYSFLSFQEDLNEWKRIQHKQERYKMFCWSWYSCFPNGYFIHQKSDMFVVLVQVCIYWRCTAS
jgi:hypothetical protein